MGWALTKNDVLKAPVGECTELDIIFVDGGKEVLSPPAINKTEDIHP